MFSLYLTYPCPYPYNINVKMIPNQMVDKRGFIDSVCTCFTSSNNKTLNARLLARVITGCHYT